MADFFAEKESSRSTSTKYLLLMRICCPLPAEHRNSTMQNCPIYGPADVFMFKLFFFPLRSSEKPKSCQVLSERLQNSTENKSNHSRRGRGLT